MVQPLGVSIKKPLKNYACEHFKQHFYVNLELYMDGKLRARERHALNTTWVGKAWEHVKKQKNIIEHSFKKCSLSNNFDEREDALININRLRLEVVVYTLCIFNCSYWKKKTSYLTQERDHR